MDNNNKEQSQHIGIRTSNAVDLVLISDISSLQNSLLLEKLEEKLNISCQLAELGQISEGTCLLLDCAFLSAEQAAEAIQQSQSWPSPPVVVLLNTTAFSAHESLMQWPKVNGIFYNCTGHATLLRGVEQILSGDYWLPRRLLNNFVETNRRMPSTQSCVTRLTRREKQILKHILNGRTNAAIASELFVSEHTIKSHLYNIFKKIDVRNRLEACNWARENL